MSTFQSLPPSNFGMGSPHIKRDGLPDYSVSRISNGNNNNSNINSQNFIKPAPYFNSSPSKGSRTLFQTQLQRR